MKPTRLLPALAPLFVVEACKLTFTAINSWTESGHRWRVQADAYEYHSSNSSQVILEVCGQFYKIAGGMLIANPQCHPHGDSMAWLDASVADGPAGTAWLHLLFSLVIKSMKYLGPKEYEDCEYINKSTG